MKLGFESTLPDGVNAGTTNETTVSITDDDAPAVTVNFGPSSYTVDEAGDVTITLTLSVDPERTVAIPITMTEQGGITSADYSGVPESVTFDSGDTETTFTFTAEDDDIDDDRESVKLTFGTLPAGVSEGTTKETVVSITDDDETIQQLVSVQVSFHAAAVAITEGGTVDITVTLSDDPERSVSIPLTTANGAGLTNADYSGVPATIDFQSGDREKSFTFTAVQDSEDEEAETLTLGFGTMPESVSIRTTSSVLITIFDSIHVSFVSDAY